MKKTKTILFRLKSISVPLLASLISIYFAAHGFKSFSSQKLLNTEITELEVRQAELAAARSDLELHVSLLSSDHIDPDYLDELVRQELGFSHPDEIIIPNKIQK
jgi:cell division protein FtsB